MWKNLLTLLISVGLCALVLWWAAPLLVPAGDETLPGYEELVAYDPARPGGHLKPGIDQLVRGERQGQGVRWITNRQGFRNSDDTSPRAAEGVLRILLYGDSFVDGMRTGQEQTIGAILEKDLERRLARKVEVLISGHNNPANAWYHWQAHGRHFQPDLVILGLTIGNDLTSHNFGAGVLPVAQSMDMLLTTDPAASMAGVNDGHAMIPDDGFVPENERSGWEVRSANLNQAIARRFYFLAHRAPPALGPRPGRPGEAMAAGFFVSLGLYYKGHIPFIESAWRDFETLLPGFVTQVRHFGSRPILITFPTRIEALPREWSKLAAALQLDPDHFDLQAPARRIAALCHQNALPCLDTSLAQREGQRTGEVFRPLGDMHLSEHGQAVTAHAIAKFVHKVMPLEPAPGPADDWLDHYRFQVREWGMDALRQDAPWMNPESGVAVLNLTDDRDALETVLTQGWLSDDGHSAFWAGEAVASIRIPVARSGVDYQIRLLAKPFLAQANQFKQKVVFSIGGERIGEQIVDRNDFTPINVLLPARHMVSPWTRVDLEFPDALIPAEISESKDRRRLGIALIGLEIRPGNR